jgi:hypothetical protein
MTKGAGSLISAIGHGMALVLVVLILGEPTAFNPPPQDAIAVELVTPKEIAAAAEHKPEKQEEAKATAQASPQTPPQSAPPESPPPPQQQSPPQQAAQQQLQAKRPEAPPVEKADASPSSQWGVAHPLMGPSLPRPGMIDTSELLALYNMRTAGFDAPADSKARLSREEVARFKAHLRRCWQLPAGFAGSSTRVVLRIFLNADGTLAAEPMLIEASASNDGPQVMRAAMQAIQRCQPFAFLPRERYGEWKQLDVGFSPRDMAGG